MSVLNLFLFLSVCTAHLSTLHTSSNYVVFQWKFLTYILRRTLHLPILRPYACLLYNYLSFNSLFCVVLYFKHAVELYVETCSSFTNTIFDSPDRYNPFIDTNSSVSTNYKRTVRIEHSISGTMMGHHLSVGFLSPGKHRILCNTPRLLFLSLW